MSYKSDEKPREWLANHIKDNPPLSTTQLSRGDLISVSPRALDAYLARLDFEPAFESAHGTEAQVEERINRYRQRLETGWYRGRSEKFLLR